MIRRQVMALMFGLILAIAISPTAFASLDCHAAFGTTPSTAVNLSRTAVPSLQQTTPSTPTTQAAQTTASLVPTGHKVALVEPVEKFTEVTVVRHSEQGSPADMHIFASDHVKQLRFISDPDAPKDQSQIQVFPTGRSNPQALGYGGQPNAIGNHNSQYQPSYSPALTTRPTGRELTQLGTGSEVMKVPDLSYDQVEAAIRYYVTKHSGDRFDPVAYDVLSSMVKSNKSLLDTAIMDYLQKHRPELLPIPQVKEGVQLSNHGADQYFWFKPEGSNEMVPARVLDLHRNGYDDQYGILAEYLGQSSIGQRTRHVVAITETELQTIARNYTDYSSKKAMEFFFESLTPLEAETIRLAESLALREYGFRNLNRYKTGSNWIVNPMGALADPTWLVTDAMIRDRWGRRAIDALLTDHETTLSQVNIHDIFSRLHPQWVLENFYDPGFEYIWVVTTDAKLKIIPRGPIGARRSAIKLMRLAGGRSIYGGGLLTFRDGKLVIKTTLPGRAMSVHDFGDDEDFTYMNPNFNAFAAAVFATQTNFRIDAVNWDDEAAFFTGNGQRTSFDYAASGVEKTEPFVRQAKAGWFRKKERTRSQERAYNVVWNHEDPTARPLNKLAWLQMEGLSASSIDDKHIMKHWAHYVLNTKHNMEFGEIKKQWRQTAKLFFPDFHPREQEPEMRELTQMVNEAYTLLEEIMNSLKK